jgi:UDP-N-acetylglucosamine 2-epimerase (non-hydrolysing)
MGYFDFLKLTSHAKVVLTDSGGVQEETTILQVPCITLRENTERPVTVTDGTNQLAGTDPDRIAQAYQRVVRGEIGRRQAPQGWDGKAAQRIVEILRERLSG